MIGYDKEYLEYFEKKEKDYRDYTENWYKNRLKKDFLPVLIMFIILSKKETAQYHGIGEENTEKKDIKGMKLYTDVLKDRKRYRKYRLSNLEKIKEKNKIYAKTEKGKACHQRARTKRRAIEKDIINTLTAQEWLDILEAYNYRCAYCGVEFNCELLPEKDHIIPISKGGHNVKENIVPACKTCNSKKGNRDYYLYVI